MLDNTCRPTNLANSADIRLPYLNGHDMRMARSEKMSHRHQRIVTRRVSEGLYLYRDFLAVLPRSRVGLL